MVSKTREPLPAALAALRACIPSPSPAAKLWWKAGQDLLGRVMVHTRSLAGIVEIDGLKYEWQLQREPQFTEDGWKGMTVSLRQTDSQREAVLEFPTPKRLLKGLPKGRSQLNDAIAARGVRAALSAGWEPASRGKPMVFMVDSNGD